MGNSIGANLAEQGICRKGRKSVSHGQFRRGASSAARGAPMRLIDADAIAASLDPLVLVEALRAAHREGGVGEVERVLIKASGTGNSALTWIASHPAPGNRRQDGDGLPRQRPLRLGAEFAVGRDPIRRRQRRAARRHPCRELHTDEDGGGFGAGGGPPGARRRRDAGRARRRRPGDNSYPLSSRRPSVDSQGVRLEPDARGRQASRFTKLKGARRRRRDADRSGNGRPRGGDRRLPHRLAHARPVR